jgi:hypothetical protein
MHENWVQRAGPSWTGQSVVQASVDGGCLEVGKRCLNSGSSSDRENGSLAAAVYRFLWNVRSWSGWTWICSPDAGNRAQVLIDGTDVVVC